jgi:L-alanine-DL-glutamate epimerase-like enolase superfamily enzyme
MTTITQVKAHPISIPLKQALWTAHEPLKAASLVLVEVQTSGGLVGFGQISSGPMKEVCDWVERLGNVAHGMNALSHVDVWERLFALTSPRPGGIAARDGLPPPLPRSARPQIMAAIGGIDIALWDI